MRKIKNILICGLGAIGGYYAGKVYDSPDFNLKVLVDKDRYLRYKNEPRIINDKVCEFDYVLPDEMGFEADLIIIATKSSGFEWAATNIKNFVSNSTVIMSFLNGISTEKVISDLYGEDKVLYSFLLGHTFFRSGRIINHDGCAKVYFGYPDNNNSDKIISVKECFDGLQIGYEVSDNILNAIWNKFCFNCCANQISALTRMTFGEMLASKKCLELMREVSSEISQIAKAEGVCDTNKFYDNVIDSLRIMIPDGKTSMLQDIEAGLKPETDIFGKTVVNLGEKYGISTPYNKVISELIELI